jgi:hypothetical protein
MKLGFPGNYRENAEVRLHGVRALMRGKLMARAGSALSETFQFHRSRCDRIVSAVLLRIAGNPVTVQQMLRSSARRPI